MSDKRYIVEKEFTYNDMPCVCVLNAMGVRCGYVGVDKNHPYFGRSVGSDKCSYAGEYRL